MVLGFVIDLTFAIENTLIDASKLFTNGEGKEEGLKVAGYSDLVIKND